MRRESVLGVPFAAPPPTAAWLHQGARSGFEVVWFQPDHDGWRVSGCTTAVEDGQVWAVDYDITVDAFWTTRRAEINGQSPAGSASTVLESDGLGRWIVNGNAAPHLDGCLDVDLESSALTNAFPVHRMDLPPGAGAPAPAAYVRALGLTVERLEQDYVRVRDQDAQQQYDYAAPAFGFTCRLHYDESGLALTYPGIAVRAA